MTDINSSENSNTEPKAPRHVFILGAKSLGAYGGYETFVNKLTEYHQNNPDIRYHVACKANGNGSRPLEDLPQAEVLERQADGKASRVLYHGAECFSVSVPEVGAAQALYYDVASFKKALDTIDKNGIQNPVVYLLACRIGPAIPWFAAQLHKRGGILLVNPDGHEWKRMKWNALIRKYWKISEQMTVRHADLLVCDSVNIESYIHQEYDRPGFTPKTTYIAYGSETGKSPIEDRNPQLLDWLAKFSLKPDDYYLVVGRFVPENNYEFMIREFMKSTTNKDLVIITNANEAFKRELDERLHFSSDPRVKFVGTLYDQDLLRKVRENAFAYLHGHEVGGTNPSLLEALSATPLNLLLDVGFNREVALDGALYWTKEEGSLTRLIAHAEQDLDEQMRQDLSNRAKRRIREAYSWEFIADEYASLFGACKKEKD